MTSSRSILQVTISNKLNHIWSWPECVFNHCLTLTCWSLFWNHHILHTIHEGFAAVDDQSHGAGTWQNKVPTLQLGSFPYGHKEFQSIITSMIMLKYLLWVWTDSWWTLTVWEEHSFSVGPAEFWMQSQLWSYWDQVRFRCGHADFLSSGGPFCPASLPFPDSLLSPPNRPGRHGTGSGQRYTSLLMSWLPNGPQCCQTPGQTLGCPWRAEKRRTSDQ